MLGMSIKLISLIKSLIIGSFTYSKSEKSKEPLRPGVCIIGSLNLRSTVSCVAVRVPKANDVNNMHESGYLIL